MLKRVQEADITWMDYSRGNVPLPDTDEGRLALEAACIGTWRWAQATAVMRLSPIARQLLGAPAEMVDLAAFLDGFHPGDRSALKTTLQAAVMRGCGFELECRLRSGSQADSWLRIKGGRRLGKAEEVHGILMAAGPRQAADVEKHRLAAIVTSSDDAIIGKTVDGIITDWNPSAELIFGYAPDEVIGKPIAILAAPDREADMPAILARIRNGERVEHYETQRRRKDGTVIDVSITVSPVFDTRGEIVGASKVARDITQAKRAQTALAEREAFLTSVLETVPEAMIVMDEDGIVQLFSVTAERLFGYAAAEAVGQTACRLMRADKDAGNLQPAARRLAMLDPRGPRVGHLTRGVRKDGSTFPMQLVIGEARSGVRPFFTAFVLDLTAQQKTQKELRELQVNLMQMSRLTALGEMASTLAHELNQPLTAIANYLQGSRMLLASGREGVLPAVRDAVNQAAEQALRAGKVIRSLRDFLARGATEHEEESLPRIVEEASALALLGVREDGVAVAFDLAPDADRVSCNKVQIQQVLLNLIRNAMEAMHQEPVRRLRVASRRCGPDLVELSVHDTGHGISPEIRDKLFQPFVTTKPRGMGVGLSISRTIVEAHGGRLWVEPGPDGGSVFRLTLRQRMTEERADDI
jgi:two-component system sensor kinase FixL